MGETPTQPLQEQPQPQPQPQQSRTTQHLTPLIVESLLECLGNLATLKGSLIETPGKKQELERLEKYIASNVLRHSHELLVCWMVVRKEYEPIILALRTLLARTLPGSPSSIPGAPVDEAKS